MASIQKRGAKWQIRVAHRLLPTPFFHTFDVEQVARDYAAQLEALLERGIVPQEMLLKKADVNDPLLIEVLRDYSKTQPVAPSDSQVLDVLMAEIAGLRVSGVTYQWADDYVRRLKVNAQLAPSTIRKRVGSLARVLDWHLRINTPLDGRVPSNPLRLLPRGYSAYSDQDAAAAPVKRDVHRDRRLLPAEDARIRQALAGVKREDRERALVVDPALELLYSLIVDTGLRLREAYRLRVDQVDLTAWVLRVEGSKGHRGAIKPRVVPLKRELRPRLQAWCTGRVGLLFPFWDGSPEGLSAVSSRLSQRFRVLFDYANVPEVTEHDLRHEACCRWVELRQPAGGWVFSDVEICRIMGWTDMRMMLRYASLRGEDLAARLG